MISGSSGGWGFDESQYLVFRVSGHSFALEVPAVREIVRAMRTSPVPHMPKAVRGLMNHRRRIVPVVDAGLLLGLEAIQDGPRSCFVVLDGPDLSAVAVEEVTRLVRIPLEDIDPAETLASGLRGPFVEGIARIDGEVIVVLDRVALLTRCLDAVTPELNTVAYPRAPMEDPS